MFVKGDYVLHIEGMFQKARSKGQSEQTVSHAQKRSCRTLSTGFHECPQGPNVVAFIGVMYIGLEQYS